jgi:hypothetical protein
MKSNLNVVRISRFIVLTIMLTMASYAADPAETIDATARGTSTQMGKDFNVKVIITQFSTPEDREMLKNAFAKGGNEGLSNALFKMKSVGRIQIPGTVGSTLAYARSIPTATGRKIRFVTNRKIAFAENRLNTRSTSYDLTAGEIDINQQDKDKSAGVLYPAAQLTVNKEGELEFQLFQNPWQLVNIIDWTKGKK